ncbi:MAG: glucose-1-phosphate thymidylyltransferase [Candidatus Schekmanbacteria bacterium]|nr:glucose-1-phosphate thymidylyltransferase [Candidatus Schekmanbacteria bacterium]
MKALVLAGGSGTRLRPITYTSAKQLVPVANKPVLFYGLEAIRDAGIHDVGVVVGYTKDEIRAALGDGSAFGLRVTYIEQPEPLGLAHAVKISESYLRGEPFVMYLGDNLIREGIVELVRRFEAAQPDCQILLAHVNHPEQFGVAELCEGRVVRLVEKPKQPKSNLALVGVYMFNDHIFEAVRDIQPSWRRELEITDAIQLMVDRGYNVLSHVIDGWWKDTGKLEDMLEANRMMLDAMADSVEGFVDKSSAVSFKVRVEAGAEIINSSVRGPAVIGRNTRIINSYVGPFTSIGDDCLIEDAEIEHSIVLERSSIIAIDQRIEDSLIGRSVAVGRSKLKPKALRLMLGDQSTVGL